MSQLPFDNIRIQEGPRWSDMTLEDFLAMPLSSRIRHVIERRVVFVSSGEIVDQKLALSALRRVRASSVQ